jgi:hypothetical protein
LALKFHCLQFALLAGKHTMAWRHEARIVSMGRFGVNEPPILTVGMKFVGEILRFEGERVLIEHQQKRADQPRKWVHEDDVQPLSKGTPKSAIAP